MRSSRQSLTAPGTGGGGGGGSYVTVYENATISPQVAFWTIVDGRATQVGLDALVTTGTTAITTKPGVDFDGDWDLTGIGATLATFKSTQGSFQTFAPGALANLSYADFYGDSFTLVPGPTFDVLDLSGCSNAISVALSAPVASSLLLPPSLINLIIHNFASIPGTHAPINVSGSNVGSVDIRDVTTTSINVSNCAGLTSLTVLSSVATSIDASNCPLLEGVLSVSGVTGGLTLNVSNCPLITTIDTSFGAAPQITSLNISGCIGITSVSIGSSVLTTVTLSTLPAATTVGFQGCALNVASVNSILVALDANGLSGGQVYLDLGTNAAPTGAGLTAKANLISKGWTVATN